MAVDLQRIAKAALDAALDQPAARAAVKKPRPRLSGGRAFLVGAGLVAAARLVAGPKARGMLDSLQQRIEESDWYSEDGASEAEEDFEDEELEGEAEEDFDDEELEVEAEEDFEDEDHDEDLSDDDFEGDEEDLASEAPEGEADEEPDEEEVEEKVEEKRPRSQTRRAKTRGRG